LSKFRTARGFR